jgi:Tfp pilus assembly protein PilN
VSLRLTISSSDHIAYKIHKRCVYESKEHEEKVYTVMGLAALVLAVVLTAGTLTLTPSTANEDNGFTERSLEGSWGFSAQ